MGLAISGSLKLELGNILYNYANNIKITHDEVISGEKAWCVEMQRVNNPDLKLFFWISDSEGFKVWRVKTTYKNKIVSLINCEYHHSDGKNPFPTYVQMYPVYGPNAEPIEEISIKEVASDYSYKPKEKEFTLAGLGLLPGATVGDSRIPKILGYWDGEKITQDIHAAFRARNKLLAQQAQEETAYWPRWAMWMGGILGLLIGCWFILYWRRRQQASTP